MIKEKLYSSQKDSTNKGEPKKSKIKSFYNWIIALLTLLLVMIFVTNSVEPIVKNIDINKLGIKAYTSGTSGTCTWTLDDNGLLTISPINGVSGTLGVDGMPPWSNNSSVKKVVFTGKVYGGNTSMDMFYSCRNLTEIDFTNFDTSRVTDMSHMFQDCSSLVKINFADFDTSNVTNMEYMFANCSSLTELDVSGFETSKVTDLSGMFNDCTSLALIDLSNFDTSNVTNMSQMFQWCESLVWVDVTSFDTKNVTDMSAMFDKCKSLTYVDVSNFDTRNVTYMTYMFQTCSSLIELDLSSFTMDRFMGWSMLDGCTSLEFISLGPNTVITNSNLDTYSIPWTRVETMEQYTSDELMAVYDGSTMAGIYVQIKDVNVVKKDSQTDRALSGVEFVIKNASGDYLASTNPTTFVSNKDSAIVYTTDSDGKFTLPFLLDGQYELIENKSADGYRQNTEPYILIVSNYRKTILKESEDIAVKVTPSKEGYVLTEELTDNDKTDKFQKNYQITEKDGYVIKKSAEWEDIENRIAKITLEVTRPNLPTSQGIPEPSGRVVYAFTICTAHGFSYDLAKKNIELLLLNYETVDLIIADGASVKNLKYIYDVKDAEEALDGLVFQPNKHWGVNLYTGLSNYFNNGYNPVAVYTSFDLLVSTLDGDRYTDDSTWDILKRYEENGAYFSLTGRHRLDSNTSVLGWKTIAGLASPSTWNGFDGSVDMGYIASIPYGYDKDFEILSLVKNYDIKYRNAVMSSNLTDTFSSKFKILSVKADNDATYTMKGRQVDFNLNNIRPGETVIFEIYAEATISGDLTEWSNTNRGIATLTEIRRIDGEKETDTITVDSPKLARTGEAIEKCLTELDKDDDGNYIITNSLIQTYAFKLQKQDETTNQPLEGVEFTLNGANYKGENIEKIVTTNSSGIAEFTEIDEGTYTLTESKPLSGYEVAIEDIDVVVSPSEGAVVYGLGEKQDNAYIVKNSVKMSSFFVEKIRNTDSLPLQGAQFNLYGHSYTGEEVDLTKYTDENGLIEFEIMDGVYQLEELAPATNYTLGQKSKWRIVKNNGIITVDGGTLESNVLKVENIAKTATITITKKWIGEPDTSVTPEVIIHGYDSNNNLKYYNSTANDESKWNKNGTTWTYTFDINDISLTYKGWEEYLGGYISSNTDENPLSIRISGTNVITNYPDKEIEITVTKTWENEGEDTSRRPEKIKLQVKNGNTVVDEYVLNVATEASHKFENLPKYNSNGEITYTVDEVEVNSGDLSKYSKSIGAVTGEDTKSVTITNRLKNTSVLVHHYIEGTTTKLSDDVTIEGVAGDSYITTIAEDIPNKYELVATPSNSTGTMTEEQIIVTYYYRVKDAIVNVKYVDRITEEEISQAQKLEGKVDDDYETSPKEISGYTLIEHSGNTKGKFEVDPLTIIYYYGYNTKATVQYIDKATGDILEQSTKTGLVGDEFATESKDFENYILVEEPQVKTVNMTRDEIVLKYYYVHVSAGVIEKHIDVNSGEILANEVHEGNEGDSYDISSKEFEGYDLVEDRLPANSRGTMTKEQIEVIYYYNYKTKVTAKYIDRLTGEELTKEEIQEGHEADDYTTERKIFDGYVLIEVPENADGKMTKDEIVVTYYYKRISGGVIVKHIDIHTEKQLADDVKIEGYEGEPYETKEKEFPGYILVEEKYPENAKGELKVEEQKVIYYYEAPAKVIVNYYDADTKEKIADEVTIEGYNEYAYETEEKTIDNYLLEKTPTNKMGIMTITVTELEDGTYEVNNTIEVDYYYRKKTFNLKIDKTIKKIIIDGNETNIKSEIGKAEIYRKALSTAKVQVLYTIKVTNDSELEGNATIQENIPNGMKMIEANNKDWTIENRTATLKTDKIAPGESKEYEVIMDWENGESSLGSITNNAKILETSNDAGFSENNVKDNEDSAIVIIAIGTGAEDNLAIIGELLAIIIVVGVLIYKKSQK